MKNLRRILLVLAILLALLAAWLYWQRPRRADMAAYVPADTLIYLEINDLPALAEGLTQTEAWRAAAQPAGLDPHFGKIGWLGRAAIWTGFAPAEQVALGRANVAVAVLGVNTSAADDALKLKPDYAVVIETHASAARQLPLAEQK